MYKRFSLKYIIIGEQSFIQKYMESNITNCIFGQSSIITVTYYSIEKVNCYTT